MENGQEVEKTVRINLLAEGSYSKDSELKDGYPEFTLGVLKKLGWDKDLTAGRTGRDPEGQFGQPGRACPGRSICRAASSAWPSRTAASPTATARRARSRSVCRIAIPTHREPIYTPRPELVAKYPTLPNARQFRMPNVGFDVQKAAVEKEIAKQFPLILSSGRLVEYEGGGEETRSNKWLAELQQDMFIEINPSDAAERGIKDGGLGLGLWCRERLQGQGQGAGHRTRRQGRHLDVRSTSPAGSRASISAANTRRAPTRSCSARA